MTREPRPCSALEAVERWCSMEGQGAYELGTGDYRPTVVGGKLIDRPWTTHEKTGRRGSDCAGFGLCWGYMLRRRRVGFARLGSPLVPYDIDDDINCNSAIEDARTERDLFRIVDGIPEPGDVLAYPTIKLVDADDGEEHLFIGHCAGVVDTSRLREWDPRYPDYTSLVLMQCRGPNERTPGVVRTDGSVFDAHDAKWPKEQHRTVVLRAVA